MIGVQQALYGPAIPALREVHQISAATAGAALSVHFAGAIAGVLALPLARRLGVPDGLFLAGSLALIAAGCVAFVFAPAWPAALVAVFVAGVGFGGVDGGVNQVFTEVYADGGHGMLNLLHGCFGVGAIAGPVAVGVLAGRAPAGYAAAFAGCALIALVALPMLRGVAGTGRSARAERPEPAERARGSSWRRAGLVGATGYAFIAFFVLNVGLETGAGGWETTHLIAIGLTAPAAASATSGFWLAFTAVRFAVVPLCRRYQARTIVIASTVLTVVAGVATLLDPLAPLAYGLLGVAVGPLYPTGLAWLAQVRPQLTSTVVAVSMVGGIWGPSAIGLAVEAYGAGAVAWAMVTLAVAGLATVVAIDRARR
nr:MFS transporter [Planosporangium mesophilum]